MVHFIFLLKTSHPKEHHKIGFTIFGSQEQEIWFLQKQLNPKSTKEKRERDRQRDPTSQWTPHVSDPRAILEGDDAGDHGGGMVDYRALATTPVMRGRLPTSLAGDRTEENADEHHHDLAELLGQEWGGMVDYRALATTPVTMAELRRGKLATEKAMRAYRGSAAAANLTMVLRGS